MSTDLTQPGFYDFETATLFNTNGDSADISKAIVSMSISESIDTDYIQGQMTIVDQVNVFQAMPIRGEEQFLLRIVDCMGEKHEYKLLCYRVTDIGPDEHGIGLTYTLHFTSEGRFFGNLTRIRRAFEETMSNSAAIIFQDYYETVTDKKLAVEDSDGILRFVVPNMLARETMKFLSERAYSETHKSSSFRFFENRREYVFATDEWCIKRGLESGDKVTLTYLRNLDASGSMKEEILNNIISISVDGNNTMRDLNRGAYGHKVREVDLVYRMINDYDYRFESQYQQLDDRPTPSHDPQFVDVVFHDPMIKSYLVFKDYASQGDPATSIANYNYSPEVISNRIGFAARLNNTLMTVRLNGRFDICAGDVVNVDAPTFGIDRTDDVNLLMSGNFYVRGVMHNMSQMKHMTTLILNKYEWAGQ